MKKYLAPIGAAAALLATKAQVFAQATNTLNPCDSQVAGSALSAACRVQNSTLGSIVGFVVTIPFVIAILIALFFLIYGGIKWITSGGDKAGVEAARNQIIAAVIGLIIVFLSFFILNLVLQFFGLSLFSLQLPTIGT